MTASSGARLAAAGMTAGTVIWLVAALSMLQPLGTDLYLPTLPGIAAAFDAPVASVQWTLSIFVAAFGAWQLVAGPLADRFGRRPVIVAGIVTYGVASAVCLAAPTIEVLIAGRLLQAIGACSAMVGARAMVRDLYAPIEGARLLAGAATIMSIAPLLGPIAGAALYEAFGWRSAFAALTGFAVVLALVTVLRLRETIRQPNPRALRPGPMLGTYGEVLRSRTFRAYAAAAASTYGALFAFIAGSSFVLIRVLGLSVTAYGFSFSTMVAGYLIGTLLCRRLVGRRGLQYTLTAGAVLQALAGGTLALLALAGVHQALAIVLPMFFVGISHALVQMPAQSGAVAPFPHAAGAASALNGFLMMGVATLVGAWLGASYDGTVYPLALTIAAFGFASLAIALTLVRRDGDVSRHG
jgi:DHA1 family bicyclomycin/chloramphenicol resistance-like MFS transporter